MVFVEIGLYHYLVLALILFCIGLFGVLVCKNLIKILMCSFLMLNAVGLNFVAFAVYNDSANLGGVCFQIFILIFSLLEIFLGAVILYSLYKYKKSTDVEKMTSLKS